MTKIQAAIAVVASAERTPAACLTVPARRDDDDYICLPRLVRSFCEVDAKLRNCFRRLVRGELPWPLYLHGDVGTGKTRAALALCDKLDSARFWTLENVIRSMLGRSAPWETVWGLPGGPRLAVLDEIGTRLRETDVDYNALKLFADWREDRPAIYISNHPPKRLTKLYDQRIESRLSCGTVFPLTGPDRRIRR